MIERRIFKQADFIEAAVDNVVEAIRDGAIWVVVVLFIFMWNFRTSISSLTVDAGVHPADGADLSLVWNLDQYDDAGRYRRRHR